MEAAPGSVRRAAALGTFAVTFGVGLAVATGTAGVAAASPQESTDTSTAASESREQPDTSDDRSDPSSLSGADDDGASSSQVEPDVEIDSDSNESAEEIETLSATTDSETSTLSDHSDTDREEVTIEDEVSTPGPADTSEPQPAKADSPPRDAHAGPDLSGPAAAPSPGPDISPVVTTAVPDRAGSTAAIPTPPTPRAARLLKLFGETLPQQVAEGPASPRLKTFLLGILNSIYRKYEDFYLNDAPTADPQQLITMPGRGVVIGSLNATDPDGDGLRYFVEQQGAFGRLTVDSNGIWTYERASNAPAGAYTDTVTVAVDDLGLNYRDVTGFFVPQTNPRLVVLVEVDPAPSTLPPPTLGFLVHNQSKDTWTVSSYQSANVSEKLFQPPPVGTQIPPGAVQPFAMYNYLFTGRAEAVYITSPQASFWIEFAVNFFGIPLTSCAKATGLGLAGSCDGPFLGLGTTAVIRD